MEEIALNYDSETIEAASDEEIQVETPPFHTGYNTPPFRVTQTTQMAPDIKREGDVSIKQYTTFGDLARERNATKWYVPDHCITVSIKCIMDNSEVAPGYFYDCLNKLDGKGTYIITGKKVYGPWTSYFFDRNSLCPICKEVHDSYNFEYKLKKDTYGGFKCWRTNEWVTCYSFKEMHLFY